MPDQLSQQFDFVSRIYQLAVDYLVAYSFQLLSAIIVIIAGIFVGRWLSKVILNMLARRDVDITLRQFIASTVRLIVLVMFVIVALSQLGISITPMIAAIGGIAVGLSLALQGPVSNYGAGLMIILTRMYRVGDTITTQGCSGQVEEISLAATILRAEDGELITIPNKHIVGEIHSNSSEYRIVEGVIGIAYSEDPRIAINTVQEVLAADDGVVHTTQPEVGINEFGDSSVNIEYRYWTQTGDYYNTIHRVNLSVFEAFKTKEINIPFPQREVRVLNRE
ncbi:MAG: mechanosensitive ion channel family protein [Pseudomonadota bacterium]